MGRGQQEDLTGDPLDGAVQTEHQTSGEVHETLGVGIIEVGEVHDHRRAVPEALTDVLGFVVGARMDRRDPVQSTDLYIAHDSSHGCALRQRRHGRGSAVTSRGLMACIRLVVVVITVVVLVLLSKSEVHHGLSQCPSHRELLSYVVSCPSVGGSELHVIDKNLRPKTTQGAGGNRGLRCRHAGGSHRSPQPTPDHRSSRQRSRWHPGGQPAGRGHTWRAA